MARHSPQKTGVETRTDKHSRERYRGVVHDSRAKRHIRGPWTSSLAAARAWRSDALDRLAKGTLSGDRGPTVRRATLTFLEGIEDGCWAPLCFGTQVPLWVGIGRVDAGTLKR